MLFVRIEGDTFARNFLKNGKGRFCCPFCLKVIVVDEFLNTRGVRVDEQDVLDNP